MKTINRVEVNNNLLIVVTCEPHKGKTATVLDASFNVMFTGTHTDARAFTETGGGLVMDDIETYGIGESEEAEESAE